MEDTFTSLNYLIIDDFEQMRVSFKGMLSGFGASNIETCSSGEQGLKALSLRSYDVVVCDYNLGDGKDGQQVLEESRHLGYLGHACCFFMITAESNMPMVLGALEQQPDEYMVKPINPDVLEHRLAAALRRKSQLKEIDQALADGDKAGAVRLCEAQRDGDLKKRLYLAKLQAELCFDLERFDDAESIYREMLQIRNFPWASFGLGKIDCLKGNLEGAAERFQGLIEGNPHYLEVYDWLAKVLVEQGEKREAQAILQRAVKLSPKLVDRQRQLGELAQENGEMEVAERAYQAAVRWGKHSCFSKADEYLRLAEIYQAGGHTPKLLRLLADGHKAFDGNPSAQIQIVSRQALVKRRLNQAEPIESYLQQIAHLAGEHKGVLAAEDLLSVADELFQLSCHDEAQMLLSILLANHHDDEAWTQRVRDLMQTHEQSHEAEALIDRSREVLKQIHSECIKLFQQGGVEKAIKLLNETVDSYPGNRTIILMSVSAMIDFMREHGADQSYLFKCRYSLNRLLERNRNDDTAVKYLQQLSPLLARPVEE
jgi:DNA-binding response OmpR family regulator